MVKVKRNANSFEWIGKGETKRKGNSTHYHQCRIGKLTFSVGDDVLINATSDEDPRTAYVGHIVSMFKHDEGKLGEQNRAMIKWFYRQREVRKNIAAKLHSDCEVLYDLSEPSEIDVETVIGNCEVVRYPADVIPDECPDRKYNMFFYRFGIQGNKMMDLDSKLPVSVSTRASVAADPVDTPNQNSRDTPRQKSVVENKCTNSTPRSLRRSVSRRSSQRSKEIRTVLSTPDSCSLAQVSKKTRLGSSTKQNSSENRVPTLKLKRTTSGNYRRKLTQEMEIEVNTLGKIIQTEKNVLKQQNHNTPKSSSAASPVVPDVPARRRKSCRFSPLDGKDISARKTPNKHTPVRRSDTPDTSSLTQRTPVASTSRSGTRRQSSAHKSTRMRKKVDYYEAGNISDSDEEFIPEPDSPESSLTDFVAESKSAKPTPKCKVSSRTTVLTPRTPRTPRGLNKRASMTPSLPKRHVNNTHHRNALEQARAKLHVSVLPEVMPCREDEFADIYQFLHSKIEDGTGGCMYISGVPGTGKTATVTQVLSCLQEEQASDQLPRFDVVEINGMKLTDPAQANVQILQQLTGQRVTPDHATSLLEKRFSTPDPRRIPTVLIVDELDLLMTRKQTILYNLFDWPTRRDAKLIAVAIANTMDLPERILMSRVSSRMGLTRMTFQPYTFRQLEEIVLSRIKEVDAFEGDAVQLVARKVAAVSGDARRALDICRRATEIAELESAGDPASCFVTMDHVNKAHSEMFSTPKIVAIRSASHQETVLLRAIIAEFHRSGLEEATFSRVYVQHITICRLEGLKPPTSTELSSLCSNLASLRLLLIENGQHDLNQRIRLNVSQEDVNYALRSS